MSAPARVVSVFPDVEALIRGLRRLRDAGYREYAVYSPLGLPELAPLMPRQDSLVRWVTLLAALFGLALGFAMPIGGSLVWDLIVGGKHSVSVLPYAVFGFELMVLVGGVSTFFFVLWLSGLGLRRLEPEYDPRFGEDRFGVALRCPPEQATQVMGLLKEAGAEEVYERRALPDV